MPPPVAPQPDPPVAGASSEQISRYVEWCIGELTLEEKVWMMSGHGFLERYVADGGEYNVSAYVTGGGNERLGLPELLFTDGPRGVALGSSTCFPVAMARGASWDVDLEERVGDAIGKEVRAHGANFFGGVCINLLRHPAWGRAQETYGEDPHLLGEMGAALVRGVQRHNVIATVKHFACNSIENARFKVDVVVGERALREVYLPHFKRCVDEGVASVMSAYNKVNGAHCGHNATLLRDILKGEWGFEGFVHSDFVLGVYGPDAAAAGLDVENPEPSHFGPKLVEAVERGEVARADIDDSVRRILGKLLEFGTRRDPQPYPPTLIACDAHRALAREAAEKGAVLLRNRDDLLPLDRAATATIAVIGPLATARNLGDFGSSLVRPPSVVTPLDGLRAYIEARGASGAGGERGAGGAGGAGREGRVAGAIVHDEGDDLRRAADVAAAAHTAVVVVGYTHHDEGEFIPTDMSLQSDADARPQGGDRERLTLPSEQEDLVLAVARANPRTVVVMVGGSAIVVERWKEEVGAILMLWYPGMEGGHALARLLFGEVSPSGRLPLSIPADPRHLPYFDRDADRIEYDLHHGYTKLDRDGVNAAFPFGFGLGYARFEYSAPKCEAGAGGDDVVVSCTVTNVGARAGEEVAQLYVGFERSRVERPRKLLRGFRKLGIEPGASVSVEFAVRAADLAYYDEGERAWVVEDVDCTAWIAPSSAVGGRAGVAFRLPAVAAGRGGS